MKRPTLKQRARRYALRVIGTDEGYVPVNVATAYEKGYLAAKSDLRKVRKSKWMGARDDATRDFLKTRSKR